MKPTKQMSKNFTTFGTSVIAMNYPRDSSWSADLFDVNGWVGRYLTITTPTTGKRCFIATTQLEADIRALNYNLDPETFNDELVALVLAFLGEDTHKQAWV